MPRKHQTMGVLHFIVVVVAAVAVVLGGGVAAAGARSSSGHRPHAAGSTSSKNPTAWNDPIVSGKVTAIGTTTTTGTCGTLGATGSFTVTNPKTKTATTVDVTGTTKFYEPGTKTAASFLDVCVGKTASATGTKGTTGAISATTVVIGQRGVFFPQPGGQGHSLESHGRGAHS